ncbi:hypothetical protein J6590_013922 [Homalodisca vitripennis]|nr:hypothetical protein J6590_013922 [Homalodisca vitripennis]
MEEKKKSGQGINLTTCCGRLDKKESVNRSCHRRKKLRVDTMASVQRLGGMLPGVSSVAESKFHDGSQRIAANMGNPVFCCQKLHWETGHRMPGRARTCLCLCIVRRLLGQTHNFVRPWELCVTSGKRVAYLAEQASVAGSCSQSLGRCLTFSLPTATLTVEGGLGILHQQIAGFYCQPDERREAEIEIVQSSKNSV